MQVWFFTLLCILALQNHAAGKRNGTKRGLPGMLTLNKKQATSFLDRRMMVENRACDNKDRRSLANECCYEMCSWEERREIPCSWDSIDLALCEFSIKLHKNCHCKGKDGSRIACAQSAIDKNFEQCFCPKKWRSCKIRMSDGHTSRKCYDPETQACNGINDCGNWEDEKNCKNFNPTDQDTALITVDGSRVENHHHKTYITFLSNDFDTCGSKIFNESNTWEKYKRAFSFGGNIWLGLDTLHSLTKTGKWNLIVKMKWWKEGEWANSESKNDPKRGEWGHAIYSNFKVKDEASNYQWTFSDSVVVDNLHLGCGVIGHYNNMMFSTADRDNDKVSSGNCAKIMRGGFWYNDCGLTEFYRHHGIKEGGMEDKKYCSSKTKWFTPSKIIMAIFHD